MIVGSAPALTKVRLCQYDGWKPGMRVQRPPSLAGRRVWCWPRPRGVCAGCPQSARLWAPSGEEGVPVGVRSGPSPPLEIVCTAALRRACTYVPNAMVWICAIALSCITAPGSQATATVKAARLCSSWWCSPSFGSAEYIMSHATYLAITPPHSGYLSSPVGA